MLKPIDFSGQPFHFLGIGGIGMSALAQILCDRQLPVSGSDLRPSHITERLQKQSAQIFYGQTANNLQEYLDTGVLPQIICSTAINATNAEYQAAVEAGCPIFHRSDLLAALIAQAQGIAIAGTHGKTTTSSLVGHLLFESHCDPTIIVGGEVRTWGGNAYSGRGNYLVAEADESDGSLVKHHPWLGVITNIELDHPDHYQTLEQVVEIFQTFAQNCQVAIGCIDCPTVREYLSLDITYGLSRDADYSADQIVYGIRGTTARIWERGAILGHLNLPLLGQHNLNNALAAIAIGRQVGLEFRTIAQAIATFEGAKRRFEIRGEHGGVRFVDDYAHHPSEIQVTLAAAQLQTASIAPQAEQHRVIAIFQPHRYSRTCTFLAEFAQSFHQADIVVVSDIYSAGEPDQGLVTGQQVANAIADHHSTVYFQPSLQSVAAFLKETLQPGDTALFLGAGNLNQIIPDVMAFYQKNDEVIPTGRAHTATKPKGIPFPATIDNTKRLNATSQSEAASSL
jgi:UDP-N-acetylmuramate--alanine ligase